MRALGQVDLVIGVSYVLLLTGVGALMLVESLRFILRAWAARPRRAPARHPWLVPAPAAEDAVPPLADLCVGDSIVAIGLGIGFLGALLGVGGGFLLVPALIYLLRVPTQMSVGTSLV